MFNHIVFVKVARQVGLLVANCAETFRRIDERWHAGSMRSRHECNDADDQVRRQPTRGGVQRRTGEQCDGEQCDGEQCDGEQRDGEQRDEWRCSVVKDFAQAQGARRMNENFEKIHVFN